MKTQRSYSLLAMLLAIVMCLSLFTACELEGDGDGDGATVTSKSSVKAYAYDYATVEEVLNSSSLAELDENNWKTSARFDMTKQWVLSPDDVQGYAYGVNLYKLENTSASAMNVKLYFKVKGDIKLTGDLISFYASLRNRNGSTIHLNSGADLNAFTLSEHTDADSPFLSIDIPAGEVFYLMLQQHFTFSSTPVDEIVGDLAPEFNAAVTLGIASSKVSSDSADSRSPDIGIDETFIDIPIYTEPPYEIETEIAAPIPKDCEYSSINMYSYIDTYGGDYIIAYDGYYNEELKLYHGETVFLLGTSTDFYDFWAKIQVDGNIYYISSHYVQYYFDSTEPTWEETTEPWWNETESETEFVICAPIECEFDTKYRSATVSAYYTYYVIAYDEYYNEQIELYNGQSVLLLGTTTNYFDYWAKIQVDGDIFYIPERYLVYEAYDEEPHHDILAQNRFKECNETVWVSFDYADITIPLYDQYLNPCVYVFGGTELVRIAISTDNQQYWSQVIYEGEIYFISTVLLGDPPMGK